jgi:hypothetical protein
MDYGGRHNVKSHPLLFLSSFTSSSTQSHNRARSGRQEPPWYTHAGGVVSPTGLTYRPHASHASTTPHPRNLQIVDGGRDTGCLQVETSSRGTETSSQTANFKKIIRARNSCNIFAWSTHYIKLHTFSARISATKIFSTPETTEAEAEAASYPSLATLHTRWWRRRRRPRLFATRSSSRRPDKNHP